MPTAYTADVVNGTMTDFRAFALRCAREFGACIMQRESPMDEPPALRQVDPYYRTAIDTARAEMAAFVALSADEHRQRCANENARARAAWEARNDDKRRVRERIDNMLDRVARWAPPTSEHEGLKSFMVQQLTETRRWDGEVWGVPPVDRTTVDYISETLDMLRRSVDRAEKALAEEEARCARQNAWIQALYASLENAA